MKRFFLFVSAFVTLFSVLEAQNYEPVKAHEAHLPFVSEQEMVDGFHKVFGQKRTKAWIPNDRVSKYYALTNVRVLENCPDKQVQSADSIRASVVYGCDSKDGRPPFRMMIDELEPLNQDTEKAQNLFRALQEKTGTSADARQPGVFCSWVSGTCYSLYRPTPYMNQIVSPRLYRNVIQKGISEKDREAVYTRGAYREEASALRVGVVGNPHWLEMVEYECVFFTHDVNRLWCERKSGESVAGEKRSVGFSLLLQIQKDGKLKVRALKPEKLSDSQQKLLGELQQVLDDIPAWSFDYLYTLDGKIFPARYLKASYNPQSSKWIFVDYIRSSPADTDISPLSLYQYKPMGW